MGLFSPIFQIVKNERVTLPEVAVDIPIVRLAAMEQDDKLQRVESIDGNIDYANLIEYHWSVFAPIQYETRESGIIPDVEWTDDLAYKPSITNRVYKLRFAFFRTI